MLRENQRHTVENVYFNYGVLSQNVLSDFLNTEYEISCFFGLNVKLGGVSFSWLLPCWEWAICMKNRTKRPGRCPKRRGLYEKSYKKAGLLPQTSGFVRKIVQKGRAVAPNVGVCTKNRTKRPGGSPKRRGLYEKSYKKAGPLLQL
jgi:hypothetical protein